MITLTTDEIARIELLIKMLRRKLLLGEWILNDEEITLDDVAILQRIVASATQQKGEPPPRLAPLVA